jgi:ribosomal protein L40E
VQTVTGTTVTIQTLRHYFNGIETSDTETVDVNTGQGNSTFVYAANLIRGNYLFPGNLDLPWTINETVPRFYGDSGFRQTNHVSVNRSDIEGLTFSLLDLYFDQATGIVVESHYTYATAATPQQTITQNLKLAESNVWAIAPSASPSESPSLSPSLPTQQGTTASPTQNGGAASQIDPLVLAFLVAVAVVVVVAAVVLARKRGKRPLQEPTEAQAVAAEAEVQGVLRCRKCGQENPEGSEFCNKCGSRLRK